MTLEIAHYWAWHLERAKYIGLALQILGLFFFLGLWWNQDRGWRWARWPMIAYFAILGLVRYAVWLLYPLISPSPVPSMRAFMIRSGAVGLLVCIAMIVFLMLDSKREWVQFRHFGPEAWNERTPTLLQWTGLIFATIALYSPFVPHPAEPGLTLVTSGFPTSFGVTLAPSILYIAGLVVAGSGTPSRAPCIFLGLVSAVASMLSEPITVHGIALTAVGVGIVTIGILSPQHRAIGPG